MVDCDKKLFPEITDRVWLAQQFCILSWSRFVISSTDNKDLKSVNQCTTYSPATSKISTKLSLFISLSIILLVSLIKSGSYLATTRT